MKIGGMHTRKDIETCTLNFTQHSRTSSTRLTNDTLWVVRVVRNLELSILSPPQPSDKASHDRRRSAGGHTCLYLRILG